MTRIVERYIHEGAHRGGNDIASAFARQGVQVREVEVIDAKPGRADALAARLRGMGSVARAHTLRAENYEPPDDAPLVLSIDELAPMADALTKYAHRQPVLVQAVGRGPGERNRCHPNLKKARWRWRGPKTLETVRDG